jgi:deoxyribonuclease (pyrimidine dimer)
VTRINVIPPGRLTDQHLIAEWRELPRVFALARPDDHTPPAYTLGTGHVRFFYPRTGYLARRQAALIAECQRRGFAISHTIAPDPVPGLDDDWTPTDADVAVNVARLREKVGAKPGWYRYMGAVVSANFYESAK